MTSDELKPMGMNPDYDDSDYAEIKRLTSSRDRARKERDDALRMLNGVRETEVIDKLFLELSQFTRAKSAKEVHVEDMLRRANEVLRSAWSIADRNGECVGWDGFRKKLRDVLDEQHVHFHGKVEE